MTPDPTLIEQELCPFCGHSASISDGSNGLHFRMICNNGTCRAAGPLERCAIDAASAWRVRVTLQGSAALPSEAQIGAGADCLRQAGTRGLNAEEAAVEVYTAMRATTPTAPNDRSRYDSVDVGRYRGIDATPTAPVQDDDALRAQNNVAQFLSAFEKFSDDKPVCYGITMGDLRKLLASRLSPTPETGLVEALTKIDAGAKLGTEMFEQRIRERKGRLTWYAVNVLQDNLDACRGTARDALSNVLPDEVSTSDKL